MAGLSIHVHAANGHCRLHDDPAVATQEPTGCRFLICGHQLYIPWSGVEHDQKPGRTTHISIEQCKVFSFSFGFIL